MHRRNFLHTSALAFGALTLSQQKIFTGLFDDPWKIKMLTKDLGIFTEKGGTILFKLSKKGIVVVDSQFPEQANHLIAELKKKSEKPFKLLINTHHHGDHTAGNISFKGITEHVLAHENSKTNQQTVAVKNKSEDKQLYPDQTYTDAWHDTVAKTKIALYYFGAGHTNGDSVVHFEKENIVHMGDLVFNRRHPFVDRSAGANMKNWITVLDKTINKFSADTTYISGHAGDGYDVVLKADDLRAFQEYLGKILQFTEEQIKAGKTKEEFLKTTTLPFETQWKGDGLQRPLQAAWEELTEGK